MSDTLGQSGGGWVETASALTPILEGQDAPVAQAEDQTFIVDVAHSLASHPEFGIVMQLGLQSDKPAEMSKAWAAVLRQYGLFVEAHSDETASPIPFKEATVRMLGSLARGGTMRAIAPKLVQEGLLRDTEQVYWVLATLTDNIDTFLTPAFTRLPKYRKKLELIRFERAFADQPPGVLVKGLLCIGGAPQENIEAVADFFSDESTTPANSMPKRKGLSLFGGMSERAYRTLIASAASEDEGERHRMLRQLSGERAAFEHISGFGVNGFHGVQSYKDFLLQVGREGHDGARVVKTGLQRMLRFYVNLHNIDVSKLMDRVGLPPLEPPPVLALEPLNVHLTARQKQHAIDSMSLDGVKA